MSPSLYKCAEFYFRNRTNTICPKKNSRNVVIKRGKLRLIVIGLHGLNNVTVKKKKHDCTIKFRP